MAIGQAVLNAAETIVATSDNDECDFLVREASALQTQDLPALTLRDTEISIRSKRKLFVDFRIREFHQKWSKPGYDDVHQLPPLVRCCRVRISGSCVRC